MGHTTPLSHLLLSCLLLAGLGNLAQAEPIKIGLNYPRTGNYKDEGLELRRGALLAVGDTLVAGLSGRLVGLNPANGSVRWEAPVATSRGTNEVERLVDVVAGASRSGLSSAMSRSITASHPAGR